MPKWKPVTPPLIMRADNGPPYQADRGLADQLLLKGIEAQCLVEICHGLLAKIRNKDATIALLQKRLAAANNIHYTRKAA